MNNQLTGSERGGCSRHTSSKVSNAAVLVVVEVHVARRGDAVHVIVRVHGLDRALQGQRGGGQLVEFSRGLIGEVIGWRRMGRQGDGSGRGLVAVVSLLDFVGLGRACYWRVGVRLQQLAFASEGRRGGRYGAT